MSVDNDASTGILTLPSLHTPTLPLDLQSEILCRLPVKHLLQLKCICKSWKSLISDPKFAKKHLHVSKTFNQHHHLIVKGREDSLLWDSTISSIFSDASTTSGVPQLQLIHPEAINHKYYDSHDSHCRQNVPSCDGILLFVVDRHSSLLWNPSIRKFKILPPLFTPQPVVVVHYAFGYDNFIDNYKVFAVASRFNEDVSCIYKNEVSVYTLGTDSWRRIDDFPHNGPICGLGTFVGGTVNWLACVSLLNLSSVIVSLNLEEESYQMLLMPDLIWKMLDLKLGVLRDCLCIFANGSEFFDIWVMKEHGIKESWTKLFSVPHVVDHGSSSFYTKVLYVSEDDQVLLEFLEPLIDSKLVVYNSKNSTFKIRRIQNISPLTVPKVYVESLISPCF